MDESTFDARVRLIELRNARYEKLEELRKTRYDKETYTIAKVPSMLKYGEDFGYGDLEVKVPLVCEKCKKEIIYETYQRRKDDVDGYKEIISNFNRLGMDAKFVYHCDDCRKNGWHAERFEIWLKERDDEFYHRTYPIEFNSYFDERYNLSFQEYIIALDFLRVCVGDSEDISKYNLNLSYKGVYNLGLKSGFIKPIVDLALYKVFDFCITYDREELKDSIKFLLKEHTENECCGFIFEDDDTIPISKQKYEKLVSIVEEIIDNKKLDEISVYDYFNFVKSLRFIFEYDGMHSDGYKNNYISLVKLKNQGYFKNEDI